MADKTVVISINGSWNILNFRLGLVRGLQAAGYRVVAIAPRDEYSDRLAEFGIEYFPIEMDPRGTSVLRDLRLFVDYYRLLGKLRPAAFLGYTIKPNVFGSLAARLRGTPTINNIAGLGETFLASGLINRLVRGLYRLALDRATVIFFQNPDDRALFVEKEIVRAERTRLLPGSGVDLSRFQPSARTVSAEQGVTFLFVGRLLHSKGVADLVEAARIVKSRYPNTRVQLLGLIQEGRGAITLETLREWERSGAIEFPGGADDVRPFLTAADCVVLPTFYPEGTPRSLLEAAAAGLPLIASNVPGCREIVEDGANGFLVPPRDPAALAERMTALLELPADARAAMGRRSREKAEQEFDERIVVTRYLEALQEI
ncbi:glycosyltransferase family 4 protein [Sphingomonas sp. LM7]|uniref:glycosyltransferase family 4 protein n=1 Tax=Sphingomonas sp. LM7 TaxID=1938607 RepID=UPI000983B6AD|nr:glycosyltransferase family 4 protein [Sphingomonas sp. LM7]AQR75547.1 glycosyltransferase family 1 protein [Sphingomonas sp. LM7]